MKSIPGFPKYHVSDNGNVFVMKKSGLLQLKPWVSGSGYKTVGLNQNNKNKKMMIHRLVALLFIDNPENKKEVNHIDGNKINNNMVNLEWCTSSENKIHSYKMGLSKYSPRKSDFSGYNSKCSKAVKQYDIDMNFIREYGSAKEAGRETGIAQGSISRVCRGIGQIAGGYKWRLKDE